VMRAGQSLNGLMGRMLGHLDEVLAADRPDRILVHGDTTTASAAALAAFHHRIPVGHVEAGLRTGRLDQPWPEEMNRRVVDVIADQLYAPTPSAADNLVAENLGEKTITVTGNTVIDALLHVAARIEHEPALRASLEQRFDFLSADKKIVLVTGHRRENFGDGFAGICAALRELGERPDVDIVYPVGSDPLDTGSAATSIM